MSRLSVCYIRNMGVQSGTERTIYATWVWNEYGTDHFIVRWTYTTDDGVSFLGSESNASSDDDTATWTAPSNATTVSVRVRPIAGKHTVNGNEVDYWTCSWSNEGRFTLAYVAPPIPSTPSIKIDGYECTVTLGNLSKDIEDSEMELRDDTKVFQYLFYFGITTETISQNVTVAAGSKYKVRARVRKKSSPWSEWSNYSDEVESPPKPVEKISSIRALTDTSVYIDWPSVRTAKKYKVEYTTNKDYFDSSNEMKSFTVDASVTHAEVTGLDSGYEWFFRVKAVNDSGESGASPIVSIKIGTAPAPPTTWSSTTTIAVGKKLILYWAHNSEDGSSQTQAELELIIGGVPKTYTITNTTDEDLKDKTSSYTLETSSYTEGTKILWRVRTRGIIDKYSDWSIQREVNVYAAPALLLNVVTMKDEPIETLETFPFRIVAQASPQTQHPVGYHISIISNTAHSTVDSYGNEKNVSIGEEIFSKYINNDSILDYKIEPGDVTLENNVEYLVNCSVSMDSGLTAGGSWMFTVAWGIPEFSPDAEIGYNSSNYTMVIRPVCYGNVGQELENINLSVFRRGIDGSLIEIASKIPCQDSYFVTDPHPALDYGRYRIVATDLSTGINNYYDIPDYPVNEKSIIIQWDEEWKNFNDSGEQILEEPTWTGSLIRLTGNIDITEKQDADISLIKYIGRSYPVSYYGTQLGSTSTWTVDVPKKDKETIYGLRRLACWMSDVYVREPSGSGYWANVTVSFSQRHLETVVPVTLEITRVSGGV